VLYRKQTLIQSALREFIVIGREVLLSTYRYPRNKISFSPRQAARCTNFCLLLYYKSGAPSTVLGTKWVPRTKKKYSEILLHIMLEENSLYTTNLQLETVIPNTHVSDLHTKFRKHSSKGLLFMAIKLKAKYRFRAPTPYCSTF
jgi:hypothetical protein